MDCDMEVGLYSIHMHRQTVKCRKEGKKVYSKLIYSKPYKTEIESKFNHNVVNFGSVIGMYIYVYNNVCIHIHVYVYMCKVQVPSTGNQSPLTPNCKTE